MRNENPTYAIKFSIQTSKTAKHNYRNFPCTEHRIKGEPQVNAIILGAPGSGKGTYSSRLQTQLGLQVISMGDIFRESLKKETGLGRKVKSYVEKGLLVPNDIVVDVLKQHLSDVTDGKGFLLDGYPRTVQQAEILEKITKIDVIILLIVPEWIIVERLSTRRICRNCASVYNVRFLKPKTEGICDKCGGPLYQRADDTEEVIKNRIRIYEEQTQPIVKLFKRDKIPFVEARCETLDAPPDNIVKEIIMDLKKLRLA